MEAMFLSLKEMTIQSGDNEKASKDTFGEQDTLLSAPTDDLKSEYKNQKFILNQESRQLQKELQTTKRMLAEALKRQNS